MRFPRFESKAKKAERKRREALAGRASSGNLSVGERQRLFRGRQK